MNKHNKANYDYWKNRAVAAESKVERQNRFITDQITNIDRLVDELRELRKLHKEDHPLTIRNASPEELIRIKAELGKTKGGE